MITLPSWVDGWVWLVAGDSLHTSGVPQDRRDRYSEGELHGRRVYTGAMERTGSRWSSVSGRSIYLPGTTTATKPSPAPLYKHSLGGCTVDIPPSNCHLSSARVISFRCAIRRQTTIWNILRPRMRSVWNSSFPGRSSPLYNVYLQSRRTRGRLQFRYNDEVMSVFFRDLTPNLAVPTADCAVAAADNTEDLRLIDGWTNKWCKYHGDMCRCHYFPSPGQLTLSPLLGVLVYRVRQ